MCDEFNLSKEMPFLLQPFVEIADRRLTFLMFFGYGLIACYGGFQIFNDEVYWDVLPITPVAQGGWVAAAPNGSVTAGCDLARRAHCSPAQLSGASCRDELTGANLAVCACTQLPVDNVLVPAGALYKDELFLTTSIQTYVAEETCTGSILGGTHGGVCNGEMVEDFHWEHSSKLYTTGFEGFRVRNKHASRNPFKKDVDAAHQCHIEGSMSVPALDAVGGCADSTTELKFTADGLGSDALCLEPDEFTVGQVLIDSIFFELLRATDEGARTSADVLLDANGAVLKSVRDSGAIVHVHIEYYNSPGATAMTYKYKPQVVDRDPVTNMNQQVLHIKEWVQTPSGAFTRNVTGQIRQGISILFYQEGTIGEFNFFLLVVTIGALGALAGGFSVMMQLAARYIFGYTAELLKVTRDKSKNKVWDVAIWDGHEHVTVPRMPPELRGEVVAGAAAQEVAASSPQRIPSQGRSTPTLLPPLETEMTELQAIDRDGQQSPNEPDGVAQRSDLTERLGVLLMEAYTRRLV